MIFEYDYASFADFSPRGRSDSSMRSKKLCGNIKRGFLPTIERMVQIIGEDEHSKFAEFLFGKVLVPTPKSAPHQAGSLWPPRLICDALLDLGHGTDIAEALIRRESVSKSATSSAANRPSVETHINSLDCTLDLMSPKNFLIVDDVITKGSTAVACAERIKQTVPGANVSIFAAMRTRSFDDAEIDRVLNPSFGTIKYFQSGKVWREP